MCSSDLADLRAEFHAAKLTDTIAAVRGAAGEVSGLGESVRVELAQFRATLAAVERLATLLERDPGALLHGRSATRPPAEVPR